MTDSTLFDQTANTDIASHLEALVGEGKKFKTPEDLAKGKHEADQFIERLQDELNNLRSELTTRTRLEEALDQLQNLQPSPNTPNHGDNNGTPAASLTETDIQNILDKREKERKALENLNKAKTKLQEIYGDDYAQKLKARGAQLGLDQKAIDDLARRSPDALLALVSPNKAPDGMYTPPASQVTFTPEPGIKPRTKAFYDNIKKANPTLYWSPKVQNQMHNDAIAAANRGEEF